MKKELYTVEETAQFLNLHIKTVRRFLREGRLKGNKIGRAWMIPAKALKEYAHGELSEEISREFPDREGKMSVSAVVEFYERRSGEASRLSNSLMAMLNNKDPAWGETRFDFIYHPEEGKSRFIIFGSPAFIGEIMHFFQIIQDQEE
jgi:excisionase family DNA binding protein